MTCFMYKHIGSCGTILYIGITQNLAVRLYAHKKNSPWFGEIAKIETKRFEKREEAKNAERMAILHYRPKHNKPYFWQQKQGLKIRFTDKSTLRLIGAIQ